jgi:integrase/recombinase XerD
MPDFVSKGSRKSNEKNRRGFSKSSKSWRMEYSLYDERGRRKYLVATERAAFLQAALQAGGKTATFCAVLTFSGARVSEVLALTPERLDEAQGTINFETLKRRKKGITRAVPMPRNLFMYLDGVHHFRKAQLDPKAANKRLWTWGRTTAWRRVQFVMRAAANPEYLAKPKSLRHAFGAEAALRRIPLTTIRKWLGHARLETTEIYTCLSGSEERELARLTWANLNGEAHL